MAVDEPITEDITESVRATREASAMLSGMADDLAAEEHHVGDAPSALAAIAEEITDAIKETLESVERGEETPEWTIQLEHSEPPKSLSEDPNPSESTPKSEKTPDLSPTKLEGTPTITPTKLELPPAPPLATPTATRWDPYWWMPGKRKG